MLEPLKSDASDNCLIDANGPLTQSNQLDADLDGDGTRCDCGFFQDGFVLGNDILDLFGNLGTGSPLHDIGVDGFILGDDIAFCFGQFNGPPG